MTRNRARPAAVRQAGFTLVELLVAMTMIGLLSVALFGGLRFGARSWDAVETRSAGREAIAITHSFLRERIRQIVHLPDGDPSDTPAEWTAGRFQFIGRWRAGPLYGGLYAFTLWFDPEGSGSLRLAWQPADAWPEDVAAPEGLAGERALVDGVSVAAFWYYGVGEAGGDPVWTPLWDSRYGPPELIRIDLEFAAASSVWPEFVAATGF